MGSVRLASGWSSSSEAISQADPESADGAAGQIHRRREGPESRHTRLSAWRSRPAQTFVHSVSGVDGAAGRRLGARPAMGGPPLSALWLGDVDHPGDAVAVCAHAEDVAPHLLVQRDGDGGAVGQLLQ